MMHSFDADVLQPPTELATYRAFYARVGNELAWVQRPGGNASLKHDWLWVKASGTWLSRALREAIFVPVELNTVHAQIAVSNDAPLSPPRGWTLRPSLETTLHALMPHRYVLHIHSIAALTWAVRTDGATRQALQAGSCDCLVLPATAYIAVKAKYRGSPRSASHINANSLFGHVSSWATLRS